MKKSISIVLALLLVCITAICFVACKSNNNSEETPDYTVSFIMEGTFEDIFEQTVKSGNCPVVPENPVKDGFNFKGWYDFDTNLAFDFTAPITKDTIVIARFTQIERTIDEVYDLVAAHEANFKTYNHYSCTDFNAGEGENDRKVSGEIVDNQIDIVGFSGFVVSYTEDALRDFIGQFANVDNYTILINGEGSSQVIAVSFKGDLGGYNYYVGIGLNSENYVNGAVMHSSTSDVTAPIEYQVTNFSYSNVD